MTVNVNNKHPDNLLHLSGCARVCLPFKPGNQSTNLLNCPTFQVQFEVDAINRDHILRSVPEILIYRRITSNLDACNSPAAEEEATFSRDIIVRADKHIISTIGFQCLVNGIILQFIKT